MTTTPARWTHTATLRGRHHYGPTQFGRVTPANSTVTLYQDPQQQNGEWITFRLGHYTGTARLAAISNVRPVA